MTAVHGSPHPAVGAGDLPPIRLERVEESLTRLGYAYAQDAEQPDVLRARFDDYRFHVLLAGAHRSVLQIRGRWSHAVDISRKVEMLKLCNEWNMNRVWPKTYVRREAESVLALYGEVSTDFFCGAADGQIDRAIECGLSTVIAFFHEVEGKLGSDLGPLSS